MSDTKQPNILLIHSDQHRYDCIGSAGNGDVRTPHIDSLAQDGVLFENSFCPYPICTPSRYSLLTGLYVHQHLGRDNHSTLPAGIETFPRILKEAGYRTKAIGKMHFTPMYLDVGFEELELADKPRPVLFEDSYYGYLSQEGIQTVDSQKPLWGFGAEESAVSEKHHVTTWIGDRAVDAIRTWKEEGNLLMVGFTRPHRPFDPPEPWNRLYDPDRLSILPGWGETWLPQDERHGHYNFSLADLNEERLRKTMAYYYACISQVDHQVGRILQLLKDKGLYDKTLIIYTSDHGEYMGYHHLMGKINYMYDPIVRTPLIIKYPGDRNRKERNRILVNNIDLAPTILKQAGCSPGKSMKGLDLAQTDTGRDFIFTESGRGSEYMARSRTRKLILHRETDKSQFFDLEKDPCEWNNLFRHPDYQGEIQQYTARLLRWALFEDPAPAHLDEKAETIFMNESFVIS